MWRRWIVPAALLVTMVCLGQDLHFKTRTVTHAPEVRDSAGVPGGVHQIVQYDHPPNTEEIAALLREGNEVVGALPDNAVVVATADGVVRGAGSAFWIGPIAPADKVSPSLLNVQGKAITALVEFYADVTLAGQDAAASAVHLKLERPEGLQVHHALVTGSAGRVFRLAQQDAVAYLFPADAALRDSATEFLACAGMLTTNGSVGQYAAIVHGWNRDVDGFAHLTYLFGSVTPRVPALVAQAEVLRALNEWARVTNVTFQPGVNPAGARNVLIKFVSGAHGDAYPFDGPKNALAHTFYPVPVNPETVAGDIHLDADENWHAGGDLDIYSVALHEVGHAIGLGHSDKPGDVMYPYYRSRAGLSANDILSAQLLYGVAGAVTPPATVTLPVEVPAVSAMRLTVDAVPVSTKAEGTSVSGTITGGKDPVSVQWQTASGAAGRAVVGTGASSVRPWNVAAIPLVVGENMVSISALDSATQSASASFTVNRASASTGTGSTLPVSVAIRSPASSVTTVSAVSMTLSGIAVGGAGITKVTWQTSGGAAGVATGTNSWIAGGVPLLQGTNTVIVRAWDEKGSTAWASAMVIRR